MCFDQIDVAYRMLQVAKGKGIKLSNLQLQKLVYIAHGYLLGSKGYPLVRGKVSAWTYGPVLNEIFKHFKEYQDTKIELENLDSVLIILSEDVEWVLDGVLNLYGNDEAMQLVSITMQDDTPWSHVWYKRGHKDDKFIEIPNDLIKHHYQKVVTDPTKVNGL